MGKTETRSRELPLSEASLECCWRPLLLLINDLPAVCTNFIAFMYAHALYFSLFRRLNQTQWTWNMNSNLWFPFLAKRPAELRRFYLVQSLGGWYSPRGWREYGLRSSILLGGPYRSRVMKGSMLCPKSGVTVESTVRITRAQLFRKLTRSRSLSNIDQKEVSTPPRDPFVVMISFLNRKYYVCDFWGLPVTVYPRDCCSQEYEKFALANLTDTSDSEI